MIIWLNANAVAIEAVASVVTVLVSIILAAITWRYVRLTSKLADVAKLQVQLQYQLQDTKRIRLLGITTQLLSVLKSLPSDQSDPEVDRRIRQSVSLQEFDFDGFCELAADVGVVASQWASRATPQIKYICQAVEGVRSTSFGERFDDYNRFAWREWSASMTFALEALRAINHELDELSLKEKASESN
jgi:type II secretory pathway pseudopilin PulG